MQGHLFLPCCCCCCWGDCLRPCLLGCKYEKQNVCVDINLISPFRNTQLLSYKMMHLARPLLLAELAENKVLSQNFSLLPESETDSQMSCQERSSETEISQGRSDAISCSSGQLESGDLSQMEGEEGEEANCLNKISLSPSTDEQQLAFVWEFDKEDDFGQFVFSETRTKLQK